MPSDLVEELLVLPGFRNVLIQGYVKPDRRVIEALDGLDRIEEFARIAAQLEAGG